MLCASIHPGIGLQYVSSKDNKTVQKSRCMHSPDHSTVGGMYGGSFTWTSIKFSRTPRLHSRLLFLQFMQSGAASSHFKWRSRHVKHPVLTRFDLDGADVGGALLSTGLDVGPSAHVVGEWMLFFRRNDDAAGADKGGILATFVISFWRFDAGI